MRLYGETIEPGLGVAKRKCRIAVFPNSRGRAGGS